MASIDKINVKGIEYTINEGKWEENNQRWDPISLEVPNFGTLTVCGNIALLFMYRKISGNIKPWQEIIVGTLPNGLTALNSSAAAVILDDHPSANLCLTVDDSTVKLISRTSASTTNSESYARGTLPFIIA